MLKMVPSSLGRHHNLADLNVNSDVCLNVAEEENFAVELINNLVRESEHFSAKVSPF